MGKKEDRVERITTLLSQAASISVRDLAVRLGVSEMTVRRDLAAMRKQNLVLDVPGFAVLNRGVASDELNSYLLGRAATVHQDEKMRIGRYAASLIEPNDCIIIDSGTTVEYIPDNIDRDTKATIFTCNLNILNRICNKPNLSVIFGGGYYHADTTSFECAESVELIKKVRAAKAFVSAAGVHEKLGVTLFNSYEMDMKNAIIRYSNERILVADSSKFGIIRPCFLADLPTFQMVITDTGLSMQWQEHIRSLGIRLVMV